MTNDDHKSNVDNAKITPLISDTNKTDNDEYFPPNTTNIAPLSPNNNGAKCNVPVKQQDAHTCNDDVNRSLLLTPPILSCTENTSPIPSQRNLWQCLNKGGGGHKEDEHKTYTTDPGIKCGITSPKNNYTESDDPNATSSPTCVSNLFCYPKLPLSHNLHRHSNRYISYQYRQPRSPKLLPPTIY
mmetsp:Transcript_14572/g.18352  ORF Transcript_14572/g.18352 Transcript_14572/m.18352 type:complete len:185 (-) Transcript_14572:52-606(-)